MRKVEMKNAAGSIVKGACYRKWNQFHPACGECMVSMHCQRETEQVKKELTAKDRAESNPLEYMLGILRNSYMEERKFGEGIRAHCFRNKKGVKAVVVWVNDSGKVKIKTAKEEVVFDKLESASQVKELFTDKGCLLDTV